MLELASISKHFGGLHVLQDVSFSMKQGSIFGLIGPNGAGKTTIVNLITGLIKPSAGEIRFNGQNLHAVEAHNITQLGIARTFQNIRIFKEMSLLENVVVGMHGHLGYSPLSMLFKLNSFQQAEASAKQRALELLSWVRLDHKAQMLADNITDCP